MSLKSVAAAAAGGLIVLAAPAAAQNTTEAPVVAPPPPAKTTTPPSDTAPPSTTVPAETVVEEPAPVVVVPQTQPAPSMTPVTIDPDVAYPNGFADPADPFANEMSLSYREQEGFDWGLLGLLGLFGLIPLFRGNGGRYVRTVYVDRDDPKRVIREERHDERDRAP